MYARPWQDDPEPPEFDDGPLCAWCDALLDDAGCCPDCEPEEDDDAPESWSAHDSE